MMTIGGAGLCLESGGDKGVESGVVLHHSPSLSPDTGKAFIELSLFVEVSIKCIFPFRIYQIPECLL